MISDDPSKIREMRRSRSICSAGMGRSPRARSDSAVSKPRPPRIWTISSATSHAISRQYSLASAASMRMSLRSSSASRLESSTTASRAKVSPAMKAILWATASCLPDRHAPLDALVRPLADDLEGHLGRRGARGRASDNRPVLRVDSATLRPWPSPATTFSAGTRTFSKLGDAVLDAPQPHELVAVQDRDSRACWPPRRRR